jgi:hypothetical protein
MTRKALMRYAPDCLKPHKPNVRSKMIGMPAYLKHYIPLAALLAVLAAIAGIVFLADFMRSGGAAYNPDDPANNKAYWEAEIERFGGTRAYAEFLKKNGEKDPELQHFSAHVIGEALYKKLGIKGITVCGAEFSFGCYHGFSTLAIAEGGRDAVMELDAACTEAYGPLSGCQHGIGHGIMEYAGRISEALTMCKELVYQPTPLLGCTSGVFMEYLTPLAGAGDGVMPEARAFNPEEPYAPCPNVPEAYRASCYFELGQWLRQTQDLDYGSICGGLAGSDRAHCFLGLGADFTRGWKDADSLIAKCSRYAPDDELVCRAGAAWQFVGGKKAAALCAYDDDTLKKTCIQTADLTEGLDISIQESLQ